MVRENARSAVIIFPAGRATVDPWLQLKDWHTGAVVAGEKSGCPVVPVAIGGSLPDWTPENVFFATFKARRSAAGYPNLPTGTPQ